ncbi:MAG: MFS transporter [Bacillota bacterium]|nr:MFS transporter [Bacillota bacterium]
MVLGSILNPINSSIISIALIPIGKAFGAQPSQTAWLVSALYLATAIGQPVVGKLIDIYGPRLLFLISTSLVGISSLIAVFAPDLWWLVVARVLLGFGTCSGYPASMYLIRREADRTGEQSPAGVLTILAVANQTIAVIGPTLGGLLIEWGGWQSAFLVNIPLSIACILLGYLRFPRITMPDRGKPASTIDFIGIIFFAITLLSALLFLMSPNRSTLYFLGISFVFGVLFSFRELRAKYPFIDLRVLTGNAPLLKTYARNMLTCVIAYSFIYGFTQWLEESRSLTPSTAGFLLLPMFVTALIISSITGKNPAIHLKLVVGGSVLLAVSVLLVMVWNNSPIYMLVAITFLMGVPQGLLNLANQNAVYFQALPAQMGSSSGLLRTSAYIGAMLASAANGLFLKSGATTAGIHHLALFCTVIGSVLVGLTLLDRSISKVSNHQKSNRGV